MDPAERLHFSCGSIKFFVVLKDSGPYYRNIGLATYLSNLLLTYRLLVAVLNRLMIHRRITIVAMRYLRSFSSHCYCNRVCVSGCSSFKVCGANVKSEWIPDVSWSSICSDGPCHSCREVCLAILFCSLVTMISSTNQSVTD